MDTQGDTTISRTKLLLRWGVGFLVAAGILWGLGAVFLSSIFIFEWDSAAGHWLPPEGVTVHWRREGRAATTFGPHGTQTSGPLEPNTPKALFWGDSYVEALQIPAEDKMFAQFEKLGTEPDFSSSFRGNRNEAVKNRAPSLIFKGVGVGLSGWDLADYYHLIPRYETLLRPVSVHVIVVQIKDLLPNGRSIVCDANGQIVLRDVPVQPSLVTVRPWLHRLGLQAFYDPAKDAMTLPGRLRFRPGPVEEPVQHGPANNGVAMPPGKKRKRIGGIKTCRNRIPKAWALSTIPLCSSSAGCF